MTAAPLPAFAQALLDPGAAVPSGVFRTWNGSDPARRFAVYRNNVASSLAAALADTFPVVQELVGPEFFGTMARHFIAACPPRSPVLTEYGDDFAAFIADYLPARALPYLPDMARLERLRVRAYHAADALALSAADIAARLADPQALPGARLGLHPSVATLVSPHAVVSLWAAHQGRGAIEDIDPLTPEAALLLRADDDAAVIGITPACAVFIQALLSHQALGAATASASALPAPDGLPFDLAAALGLLIRHQAICTWSSAP